MAERTFTDQQVREVLDGYAEQVSGLEARLFVAVDSLRQVAALYTTEVARLPLDDSVPVPVHLLRMVATAVRVEERKGASGA